MGHSLEKMAAFFEERARGQVGLMVTGGIAPNTEGRLYPFAAMMATPSDAARHRLVTDAVHEHGGPKIAMQILHGGRYSYHPLAVAPSSKQAPIGWFKPREMTGKAIEKTIADYGRCAALAQEAGYDGVQLRPRPPWRSERLVSSCASSLLHHAATRYTRLESTVPPIY